mmetsp:Transcript_30302/g.33856  ORF Transcript_30302/g.33856 Transcript_30302/m.33856 type:complete len:582 (+) Transcript_30302:6-1751(+)
MVCTAITILFTALVVLQAQQLDQFAVTTSGKMSFRNNGRIVGDFVSTGGLEARNDFTFENGFVQGDVELRNNPRGQTLDVVGSVVTRNGVDIDDINTFTLDPSNALDFETILGIIPQPQNMTFTNETRVFNFGEVFRATSFRSIGSGSRCKTFPNDIQSSTHISGSVVIINGDVSVRNNVELTFDENARVIINGNLDLGNNVEVSFPNCKGTLHIYGDLIARNDFEACGGIWVNGTTDVRNDAKFSGFVRSDTLSTRNDALFERKDLGLPTGFNPQYSVLTTQYDVPTNEFPVDTPYDIFQAYPDAPGEVKFPLMIFLGGGSGFNNSDGYSRLAINIASQGYIVAVASRFFILPPFTNVANIVPCSTLDALEAFWVSNPDQKPNVDMDNIIFAGHSFGGANALNCVSANEQGAPICNGTYSIQCGLFDVTGRTNIKGVVQYGGFIAGDLRGQPPAFIPRLLPGKFTGWVTGDIDAHSVFQFVDNVMKGYNRYTRSGDKNLAFFIKGANHWIVSNNADPTTRVSPDLFPRIDEDKASKIVATLFHHTIEYFNNDSEESLKYLTGGFREADEVFPFDVPVVCE